MNINNKTLKVSALAGILSIGLLSGSYALLQKDITLVVKGETQKVTTFKDSVGDVLKEQGIKYDSNDIISENLSSKLKDGMNIEIVDVTIETIKEPKNINYDVEFVEDSSLVKGTTKVLQDGVNGINDFVYTLTYYNGELVEKKFIEELVTVQPKNKIVKKGTKIDIQMASSRGGTSRTNEASMSTVNNSVSNNKHMKVVATAYSGDTITSTGTTPKWGTIAVDPSIIPYGTKVYIPQFDMTFIAEDTGSAIKGNKIDIFMPDASKVSNWGRKTIEIYIVG